MSKPSAVIERAVGCAALRSWGWVASLAVVVFAAAVDLARADKAEKPSAKATDASQPVEEPGFAWQDGPTKGRLGNLAEIDIPKGFGFLDGPETIKLMTRLQNPTNGSELGTIAPDGFDWFMVFEFSDIGYVKDDEKDKLDAAGLLESIKAGTARGNEERKRRGWATMEITGWQTPPHYDPTTHRLEWALSATSQGESIVNFNTRILGRGGMMSVTVVCDPVQLPKVLPVAKKLLTGFTYTPGNKYGEWRAGDKVAEVGLTALIAGGGLAVAAKTGLLAKLGVLIAKGWKLIALAVVGVGAFIKKIFGGGRSTS